ncbi:hypothetical protein CLQ_14473 (plasmid) [Clostridium botulinum Af84]|uniref:hypothetical protein n=1 Tax=Clostridium botulinum TaxID=1491 RepID=UPI00035BA676|nr:hypothetical protein [Clostridium botulinum]APR02756.1 hypothetical protein RSJ2_3760 [Clostridium botulinum]AUN19827.1 hypothetical protein B2M06_19990 [Clostridium botulinum]EPS54500.1 hypothetical protein CLQ_14473 [Clostridium botulinum Af84]NFM84391.1 hypothetical protein [Clostridium botulinum]NFP13236.1 hypothetical protein [Clostridium botulinum]
MARSKYVWLIVYEAGETQFVKAQTVDQIFYCNELLKSTDSIINMTRMDVADDLRYKEAIDISFED